jgi:hypothetical protein
LTKSKSSIYIKLSRRKKNSFIYKLNDFVFPICSDLNKLIMNYFVIEGYKDAAETFSQECGLLPSIDVDSIQDRMNIRNAIQNGNVEEAIERVNDLNPEVIYIYYMVL